MKITKLEYQKKDQNRVNVYIDDQFVAGLGQDDVLKLNLYKNKEITPEEQIKIIEDSDFGKLFNQALNFLSFRPRSEWEIRFKFRNEDQQMVDKILGKLKKINQVNDEEFARWFIDQRTTFKPEGKRALKYELTRKGIDKKVIDRVLEENQESESELARRAIGRKKFKSREQQTRFLASRGFSWDTISGILGEVLPE